MKLAITGLAGAGKTTIFEALARNLASAGHKGETRLAVIRVPDERLETLTAMYQPKKTIAAQVEYILPAASKDKKEADPWIGLREADALIQVVRNFTEAGQDPADPLADLKTLDQEFILSDLVQVEKRIERIGQEKARGRKTDPEEAALIEACHGHLEQEQPLRGFADLAKAPQLRGFALLSAKPRLVVFNNADEDTALPALGEGLARETCIVMRGKLEREIGQMEADEAAAFLAEFDISALAADVVIRRSYDILGLISFFTVGPDEVRAWTIKKDTCAQDAAGAIHSDFKKGFIRAEVVAYDDLMAAGTYAEARKQAKVRLEGKTYVVKDGDIITFRFNV